MCGFSLLKCFANATHSSPHRRAASFICFPRLIIRKMKITSKSRTERRRPGGYSSQLDAKFETRNHGARLKWHRLGRPNRKGNAETKQTENFKIDCDGKIPRNSKPSQRKSKQRNSLPPEISSPMALRWIPCVSYDSLSTPFLFWAATLFVYPATISQPLASGTDTISKTLLSNCLAYVNTFC